MDMKRKNETALELSRRTHCARRIGGPLAGALALQLAALESPAELQAQTRIRPRPARLGRAPGLRALVTQEYLEIDVVLSNGKLSVGGIVKRAFKKAQLVKRPLKARFEVRLYTTGIVRDIVPFEIQLSNAAVSPPGSGLERQLGHKPAQKERGSTTIRVPFAGYLTHAVIVDSKTGQRIRIDLRLFSGRPVGKRVRPQTLKFGLDQRNPRRGKSATAQGYGLGAMVPLLDAEPAKGKRPLASKAPGRTVRKKAPANKPPATFPVDLKP